MKRSTAILGTIAILLAGTACGLLALFSVPTAHWGAAEQSPFHSAVLADDLAAAKTLLPKSPPGAADAQLFYARSAPMAEWLISSGASVKARAHGNYTPLHFAASIGADEVVAVLLRHGADVDAVNDGKTTPLMLAVSGFTGDPDEGFEGQGFKTQDRRLAVTQLLLKAGAHVNLRDSGGQTALGEAMSAGNAKDVGQLLIDAGADVNVRSVDNITPLHEAAGSGDLESIRLLVAHGADITVKEWQGKRPLDCVHDTGPEADEMRKLLTK